MSTATTSRMIDAAKQVAATVASTRGVQSAWVDDWGQFGNFSLFVKVAPRADVDLRLIRRELKAALERFAPSARFRRITMPRRRYTPRSWGRPSFLGWDSDGQRYEGYGLIAIDLDFHAFDAARNCFPALQPEGPFELGAWGAPAHANGAPAPHIP